MARDVVYPTDTVASAILDKINGDIEELYDRVSSLEQGILSQIVQGHGGGFNADLLDGQHASGFVGASEYTDSAILIKLKNVDGHGSGLDADTIDGHHASAFRPPPAPIVITTSTQASPSNAYYVGNISQPIVVLLPANPSSGDTVSVVDGYGNAGMYNIVISPQGKKISGVVQDCIIDVPKAGVECKYTDDSLGWTVASY